MDNSIFTILKQVFLYAPYFIKGRLQKITMELKNLKSGEGAIIEMNGKKMAAYKDKKGKVIYLSPVCKHRGCIVGWNNADKTWDCPCHGSRYEADGSLKHGPAKIGLDKADINFYKTLT